MLSRISTIIGIVAAIIVIIVFFTGRQYLPDFFQSKNSGIVFNGKWDEEKAKSITLKLLKDYGDSKKYKVPYSDPSMRSEMKHFIHDVYYLKYGSHDSFVIVAYSIPDDGPYTCHVCAPSLSFIEFKNTSEGWKLGTKNLGALVEGAWGNPPLEINVLAIGKDNYGVVIENSDGGQGYDHSYTGIFADISGEFRKVFAVITGQDYSGAEGPNPSHLWTTKINFNDISNSRFYDLHLKRSGVGLEGRKKEEIYKFDGRKYSSSNIYN